MTKKKKEHGDELQCIRETIQTIDLVFNAMPKKHSQQQKKHLGIVFPCEKNKKLGEKEEEEILQLAISLLLVVRMKLSNKQ